MHQDAFVKSTYPSKTYHRQLPQCRTTGTALLVGQIKHPGSGSVDVSDKHSLIVHRFSFLSEINTALQLTGPENLE